MSTLLNYLNVLDKDVNLLLAHRSDPVRAAREFGLSPSEQILIASGDKQRLAEILDLPFRDFDSIDSIEIDPWR